MSFWKKIDENFEEVLCAALLSVIVILLGIQISLRFGFKTGIDWAEEIIRYCFVWLNYLGVALGAKKLGHIRITTFINFFSKKIQPVFLIVADFFWIVFNIAVILISFEMIKIMFRFRTVSPTLQINIIWAYLIVPIGFALTTGRVLQANYRLYKRSRAKVREELENEDR
jgi:TRAP-type C4-dicarboxylate transport system permease small subunit